MDTNLTPAEQYEEPYIGMPVYLDDHCTGVETPQCSNLNEDECDHIPISNCTPGTCIEEFPLAMAYVPVQQFENLYEPLEGLNRGTIFRDLDLPFKGGMRR